MQCSVAICLIRKLKNILINENFDINVSDIL